MKIATTLLGIICLLSASMAYAGEKCDERKMVEVLKSEIQNVVKQAGTEWFAVSNIKVSGPFSASYRMLFSFDLISRRAGVVSSDATLGEITFDFDCASTGVHTTSTSGVEGVFVKQ